MECIILLLAVLEGLILVVAGRFVVEMLKNLHMTTRSVFSQLKLLNLGHSFFFLFGTILGRFICICILQCSCASKKLHWIEWRASLMTNHCTNGM